MGCCQERSCCCSKQKCCCHSACSCCSQKVCSSCGKGSQCCQQCECKCADKFFELADCAWKEVLKEKIKNHIQSNAKNMDELARLISEANHERWQKKMENKVCSCGFEEKLKNFFGQSCHSK